MTKDIFVGVRNSVSNWDEEKFCKIKVKVKHSGNFQNWKVAEEKLCELINKFIEDNLEKKINSEEKK